MRHSSQIWYIWVSGQYVTQITARGKRDAVRKAERHVKFLTKRCGIQSYITDIVIEVTKQHKRANYSA